MAMNNVAPPVSIQGPHDQDIQDFYHFVESKRQRGVRLNSDQATAQCPFGFSYCDWIPVFDIEEYLTPTKITQLLQSVYGKSIRLPVQAEHVEDDCLKIFTILLLIQRGDYIKYFVENSLWDESLPFRSRPTDFPNLANSPEDFWPQFEEIQWQLCAHYFKRVHVNTRLHKSVILPITEWEQLVDNGESGTICKIRIHPEGHGLRDDEDRPRDDEDKPLPQAVFDPDVFVIKSFNASSTRRLNYYDSEVDAFKTLRCNTRHAPPEIVRFYGSFIQNGTHNILLEFADAGTLEQYFETQNAPDEPEDILSFWKSMKGLTRGLANIHTAELSPTQKAADMCYGYHQDLKPSNILVFTYGADSPYRYRFKIADLGLSHFVQTRYPMSDVKGEGNPGTRTYGAPENHRAREINQFNMKFAQKSDIWSFACICSVAAAWVVGGPPRIQRYSEAREEARKMAGVEDSDCFHDDVKVLPIVQKYHEDILVEKARKFDNITGRLWSTVLRKAFSEHVSERLWAEQLHFAMIELLKSPKQQTPPQTPPEQRPGGWAPFFEEPQDMADSDMIRYPRPDTQQTRIPRQMTNPPYDSPPLTNFHRSSFDQSQSQASRQSFLGNSSHRFVSPAISSSPENSGMISHEGSPPTPTTTKHANASEKPQLFGQRYPTGTSIAPARGMSTASRDTPVRTQSQSQFQSQPQPQYGTNAPSRSGIMFYPPRQDQSSTTGYSNSVTVPIQEEAMRPSPHGQASLYSAMGPPSTISGSVQRQYHAVPPRDSYPPREFIRDPNCSRHGVHGGNGEVEYMSVKDLMDWFNKKKEVPHAGLKEDLRKRDHVFVIDDSVSMRAHWTEVVNLFSILAKFIKDCDDDGIELFFTVNRHERMKEKHTTQLIQKIKSLEGSLDSSSEPATVLREIFDKKRCSTLRDGKRKYGAIGSRIEAPLTVYILTDGVWQPSTNLWPEISQIVDLLEQKPSKGPKHVGIQFIQFGDDVRMTRKLKEYDDSNLRRDIVDHEPCDGNAWKMLLGSVNTSFDNAECTCSFDPNPTFADRS